MDDKVPVHGRAADERGLSRVLSELRRWHVFRAAAGYGVIAWLLIQVVATVGPAFDLPGWILRAVVLAAVGGFLATMAFMLFRPRSDTRSRVPVYLSKRARVLAGLGVILIAVISGSLALRSLRATEQISIAVLPFDDLSATHDQTYFSEGVAEEILSTLSAEKGLKVLGRTSASEIDRGADPASIRKSLGVTHLLEGSTRVFGDDLRVNVRLVDTSDGRQVWEEEYRGAPSNIFNVQDQVARTVVRRLRGTFFQAAAVKRAPTGPIDAYETYLAARALLRKNSTPDVKRAWQMARQIVQAHPEYAPGHALFAETTLNLSDTPYSYTPEFPWSKALPIALHHAREAVRLAPDRAEGYAALGLALPLEKRIPQYQRALALDPSRSDVRLRLALALDELQRPDQAFEAYREAVDMDPISPALINRYVQMLAISGRAEEALSAIRQFEQRSGLHAQAWRFRGAVLAYQGDLSGAVLARQRALQLDAGLPYQREWLAQYFHLLSLPDHIAPFALDLPLKLRFFVTDDRGALRSLVLTEGAAAWKTNGLDVALFSLARARDWPALLRLYDVRGIENQQVCLLDPAFAPIFALALRQMRRTQEAARLLICTQAQVNRLLKMRYRSPDEAPGELEMVQAAILATNNDARALGWLNKAVERGWVGQYYSANLADWPQFDLFRGDARYTAIQQQLDAITARERADVLARR